MRMVSAAADKTIVATKTSKIALILRMVLLKYCVIF